VRAGAGELDRRDHARRGSAARRRGHESRHHLVTTQHDFNICGDLATFTFETTGHTTPVDTGNGFHFSFTDVDFYTVDFDDRPSAHGQPERPRLFTSTPTLVMS
jgi:hypothetical protein